ncbi:MAG: sulfatase-like hydrolase/transferase, partial [Anaerolineaceae bacterium]|nr:sulfatase-like hydrolase/transferase [Anaerolineaceae bacterium]
MTEQKLKSQTAPHAWSSLFILSGTAAFLYIFMEWLFIITKPSFLRYLGFIDKAGILIFIGSLMVAFSLLGTFALFLLQKLPFLKKLKNQIFYVGALLPSSILAVLALLMIDNFTYTLFRYGIVSSVGWKRGVYALGFLLLILLIYREILRAIPKFAPLLNKTGVKTWLRILAILIALTALTPFVLGGNPTTTAAQNIQSNPLDDLPNIILITVDGIKADHTSLYGYERDTTPFLKQLSEISLVAENAFTNSGNTAGSLVSIFTGKYPAQTRMLYPPDVLQEGDAYDHLPAILHSAGYHTIQYGYTQYVDAYTQNVLNGFDEVNGRGFSISPIYERFKQFLPANQSYFLYETTNRVLDRLRHIFFLKTMQNSYRGVTDVSDSFKDIEKFHFLYKEFENAQQPIFAHIHWMGTHGAKFFPKEQVFSAGQDPALQGEWEVDFYDDSILEFDQDFKDFYYRMKERGFLKNTIFVITSDHGQIYVTDERIPLLIHFADGQHAGSIQSNVQLMDISPTLLDALGFPALSYMVGNSLL